MSMATVEIRAQGIVGKQALPPPRRECREHRVPDAG